MTEDAIKSANLRIAEPGSVLIVVRSSILQHTLPVAINTQSVVINQDVKVLLPSDVLNGRFLAWYLTVLQDYLLPIITKHSTTVHSVNTREFEQIKIPLPSLSKQQELVAVMDEARSQRRQKLAEADALLSNLDDYLLNTIGLDIKTPQGKVFAVATREARGRVDVDFHSLKARTIRQGIEHGIYQSTSIKELCEYAVTGFAAGKADQAFDFEKGVPHLRPLNLNIYGDISIEPTKFVPRDSVKENIAIPVVMRYSSNNGQTSCEYLVESLVT